MTGENKRQNIADEIERADEAFREAEILVGAGLTNGAVSRAYYVVFHLARAALLTRGIEPKTHSGALKLVNTELTRKGLLPSFNKLLSGLQRSREVADYDAAVSFTGDEAKEFVADAETFRVAVLDLLRREGWVGATEPPHG